MTDLFEKMKEIDEQEQQAQDRPFDMNNINPLQQYLLPQENPWKPSGTVGRTFAAIDLLSRPNYALYGGLKSRAEGEGFGSGAYRGITGNERSESWDVLDTYFGKNQWDPAYRVLKALGVPEDSTVMDAETGIRNLYMTLLEPDPLMAAGLIGKGVGIAGKALKATKLGEKVAPKVEKAGEALQPLAKHFLHPAEMEKGDVAMRHIRDMKEQQAINLERYDQLMQQIPVKNMTPQDIEYTWDVLEKGKDYSELGKVMPKEGVQHLEAMRDQSRKLAQDIMAKEINIGFPSEAKSHMIDEADVNYWARRLTPGGEAARYKTYAREGKAGLINEPGRKIYKYVDENGKIVDITDPTHEASRIQVKSEGKNKFFWDKVDKKYVEQRQASTKEIKDWITAKGELPPDYDPNFARTMTSHIQNQLGRYHTLTMLEDLLGSGDVVRLKRSKATGGYIVPSGMQQLSGRGGSAFAARPNIANLYERVASTYRNPSDFISAVERFFKYNWVGKNIKRLTTVFARNVLGLHPQYLNRNLLSNFQLAWLAGVKNPYRAIQAADLQYEFATKQWGKPFLKGISNEQLMNKYHRRGLLGRTFSESFMSQPLNQEYEILEALRGKGGIKGKVAGALQAPAKLGSRVVDFGFRVNTAVEDNAKLMVALDYLRKNKDKHKSLNELIDASIQHGQNFLFDYTDMSRLEKQLKVVFPFYMWTRNMTGRALKDLASQPHRLAVLGRRFNIAGEDLLGGEILPDWERDIAPRLTRLSGGVRLGPKSLPGKALAALGYPLDKSYMFNMGSYSPLQTIEDFYQSVKAPRDSSWLGTPLAMAEGAGRWALSQTSPYLAGAYSFQTGQSPAFERPIDWAATTPRQAAAGGLTSGTDFLFGQEMTPAAKSALMTLGAPASRYIGEANKLIPALTGKLADPRYPTMSVPEALTGYLTGFRLEKDDPGSRARQQAFQYRQALSAAQWTKKNIIAAGNKVPASLEKKIADLKQAITYWGKQGRQQRGPQSKAEFQRLLDKYK